MIQEYNSWNKVTALYKLQYRLHIESHLIDGFLKMMI